MNMTIQMRYLCLPCICIATMNMTIWMHYLCLQAKQVEKTAIEEGIRENGTEDSDKVIQAVLAARHAQVSWLTGQLAWLTGWSV